MLARVARPWYNQDTLSPIYRVKSCAGPYMWALNLFNAAYPS